MVKDRKSATTQMVLTHQRRVLLVGHDTHPSPKMIKLTVHEETRGQWKKRPNPEQPTHNHDSVANRQHPAHLHWCGADPPTSCPTHVADHRGLARNEVTFLPFSRRSWRLCDINMSQSFIWHTHTLILEGYTYSWHDKIQIGFLCQDQSGTGISNLLGGNYISIVPPRLHPW